MSDDALSKEMVTMEKQQRGLAFLFVLLATVCAAAQGKAPEPPKDVLVFTNGDQLSGLLVRGVGNSVVFRSDMAGEITVTLDNVKELRTNGDFAVLQHHTPLAESRKVVPAKIDVTEAGVVLRSPSGEQAPPIPVASVAYIVDGASFQNELAQDVGFLHGWNGSVNLGATLIQATEHGGTFSGGFSLFRQVPVLTFFRARNKTTANFQESYGTLTTPILPPVTPRPPDSVVKTNILHADAERDQYFSRKWYALGQLAFDHNYAQGLDLQQIYGLGAGYTPFSTETQQLDLKADIHYEKQQFNNGTTNDLIGSTFAESYRRVLPRTIVFTEGASIAPAWNNLNAYSANGNASLVVPVFRRLAMNFSATDSFLNNPADGYQKNSLQFITGLTYALR